MTSSLSLRAAIVSATIFLVFVLIWHIGVGGVSPVQQMDPEYAKLMGITATQRQVGNAGAARCRRESLGTPAAAVLR